MVFCLAIPSVNFCYITFKISLAPYLFNLFIYIHYLYMISSQQIEMDVKLKNVMLARSGFSSVLPGSCALGFTELFKCASSVLFN